MLCLRFWKYRLYNLVQLCIVNCVFQLCFALIIRKKYIFKHVFTSKVNSVSKNQSFFKTVDRKIVFSTNIFQNSCVSELCFSTSTKNHHFQMNFPNKIVFLSCVLELNFYQLYKLVPQQLCCCVVFQFQKWELCCCAWYHYCVLWYPGQAWYTCLTRKKMIQKALKLNLTCPLLDMPPYCHSP